MKRLCVVVPYRDREKHLEIFAPAINKTLKEQKIDFGLLIVEQGDKKPFNRAKLLNVGFDYTKGEYDYYCFHDIDMIPVKSDYSYCERPTHLAAKAQQFDWALPYEQYFGGVTIFDKESFLEINGYCNEYWGWGAEDDDVYNRCSLKGVKIFRKQCSYESLHHERDIDQDLYKKNVDLLGQTAKLPDGGEKLSGLSTLKYKVKKKERNHYYTKITVTI